MSKLPRFTFGEIDATQKLASSALDYTKKIVVAEDSGEPVGTPKVQDALNDLKHNAVGYTLMMILSKNLLSVDEIQRIDDALTDQLNKDAE